MTMGAGASAEAKKQHGEVFTPPSIVFQMILTPEIRAELVDVDKGIFDPCCGQGQFPASELVWRLFFNIDKLDEQLALRALTTIIGVDIQEKNVDQCKAHMLATLCDAYEFFTGKPFEAILTAAKIIQHRFIAGDSLNDLEGCAARLGLKMDKREEPKPAKGKKRETQQLTLF